MGKKRRKKRAAGDALAPSGPEAPAESVSEAAGQQPRESADPDAVKPGAEGENATQSGRRDFLTLSGNLLVGVCGLAVVTGGLRMALPDFDTGQPERFALGLPADFKMQTLTWMRAQDLFVIHAADGFGAFSARCTHLGCTVRRTADGFACPCHGAKFDPMGKVLAGPARIDLPWFALWRASDGRLWVDTRVQVAPEPRQIERLDRASVFGG